MSWVRAYEASSQPEAHLVKGFLEERGVPCLLRSGGPSVYPVMAFGTDVLVPADWLAVARRLLAGRRHPRRGVVSIRHAKRKKA